MRIKMNSDLAQSVLSKENLYDPIFLLKAATAVYTSFASMSLYKNKLAFDNFFAKLVGGHFALMSQLWLASSKNKIINIPNGPRLMALGPHRTGWEAIVFASLIKGLPPRYLATDDFNSQIPGLVYLLSLFNVIVVEANPKNAEKGKTANSQVIEKSVDALKNGDCVALFPQGNFSLDEKEPFRVYEGIARIAMEAKVPIDVYRLDGFWSFSSWIPLSIRNSKIYRAAFSAILPNSVLATECPVIDFHLDPNNKLDEAETINEICAILYAYYRETKQLSPNEIKTIDKEVELGLHRPIWENKLAQYHKEKAQRDSEKKDLEDLRKQQQLIKEKNESAKEALKIELKPLRDEAKSLFSKCSFYQIPIEQLKADKVKNLSEESLALYQKMNDSVKNFKAIEASKIGDKEYLIDVYEQLTLELDVIKDDISRLETPSDKKYLTALIDKTINDFTEASSIFCPKVF